MYTAIIFVAGCAAGAIGLVLMAYVFGYVGIHDDCNYGRIDQRGVRDRLA